MQEAQAHKGHHAHAHVLDVVDADVRQAAAARPPCQKHHHACRRVGKPTGKNRLRGTHGEQCHDPANQVACPKLLGILAIQAAACRLAMNGDRSQRSRNVRVKRGAAAFKGAKVLGAVPLSMARKYPIKVPLRGRNLRPQRTTRLAFGERLSELGLFVHALRLDKLASG